jgi:hypothetical protein
MPSNLLILQSLVFFISLVSFSLSEANFFYSLSWAYSAATASFYSTSSLAFNSSSSLSSAFAFASAVSALIFYYLAEISVVIAYCSLAFADAYCFSASSRAPLFCSAFLVASSFSFLA